MARSLANRRTAAVIAAALALGIAAPAADASPIDQGPRVSALDWTAPAPATTVHWSTSRPNGSDISDWVYVTIGSGVAALALIGAAGTRSTTRRRRQRTSLQPRVWPDTKPGNASTPRSS